MSPLFPLFWKFESFVPFILKVLVLCSPSFEIFSPFYGFFGSMFWKFEPFVSYFVIKLLQSFNPGSLFHYLLSIQAFQSWASFHWKWRYDVTLIKIRRHDRSHLRVDAWEEDSRNKVDKFNVCMFQCLSVSIPHHLSVSPCSTLVLDLVDSAW